MEGQENTATATTILAGHMGKWGFEFVSFVAIIALDGSDSSEGIQGIGVSVNS